MTSRRPSFRLRNCRAFLLAATLVGAGLQAAPVLPTGGTVVAGAGSVAASGSTLTVTQNTAKLAVDWRSFSIGEGATVRFVQPSASAVALNRVTGGDASVIQGALTSNGQVFLLNPSGVLFSKTAQVNVGGLVASTLALSNDDFLAGNYAFSAPGAGVVVNEGNLLAVGGGSVSLIAAKVVNDGSIVADRGSVNLAAGARVTLNLGGLVNVSVQEGAVDALVRNGGAIRADGGQVLLTARGAGELAAAAISNDGLIEARTLATGEQGEIRLLGGLTGGDTVSVAGSLDVSAPNGGNGGFVETSAAGVVIAEGASINALAPAGKAGSWLLDPTYIEIIATGGVGSLSGLPATGTSQISVATLSSALNSADVSLEAANQIDFQVAFNHSGTRDAVLTLLAPTIKLGGDITATGRHLGLVFGNGSTYAGNVFLYNPAGSAVITRTLTTNGGNIVFNGNIGGAHDFVVDAGSGEVRMSATVDGTFTSWQQIYGDLAFRYQAGGRVGDITTINFTNSTVSFFDGVSTYQANQSELSAISGRPFSFPTGYLVIPANTIMDLNAQRVPITLTHADGTTDTSLTSANNGQVTFPNVPTSVSKLEFEQTNGSWTEILAVGISWMSNAAAGKVLNLTIKGGQTTIDSGRTIAVAGNITVATAKFVNNSGSTALQPGSGKTWQVWSTNPDPFDGTTGDVDGNLPFDFKQYGATYGVTTPGQATGNGMFYSYQPNLAASLINSVTKVYNGNTACLNLTNSNYDVPSGAVDGDIVTFTGTLPTTGTYADKNVGTGINITSAVIPMTNIRAVSSVATGSKPVYGYGPTSLVATGYIGIITKATLTAVGGSTGVTAQDRQYNGLLGAMLDLNTVTLQGLISGDGITLTGATGNFGTADVGTNKNVTVNGLTFSGSPSVLANYDLPASFVVQASITRAPLSITANNDSQNGGVYSGGNGVSYSGFVNGETYSVLGGSLVYSGTSQGASTSGTYVITPGGLTSDNYQITFVDGQLVFTATPAPVPAVDPRDFIPKPAVVPVYPIGQMAVQMPMKVGGLNYVPVSSANGGKAASAKGGESSGENKIGQAEDRIDKGASRAIQGPTDVFVIDGGINLGAKPLSAE